MPIDRATVLGTASAALLSTGAMGLPRPLDR
jgi:hypothetical protein